MRSERATGTAGGSVSSDWRRTVDGVNRSAGAGEQRRGKSETGHSVEINKLRP